MKNCLIIIAIFFTSHVLDETSTPDELIKEYVSTMKRQKEISYTYTLDRRQEASAFASPQIEKMIASVKTDGCRVDHRARIWANYKDRNDPNISAVPPREQSFLWDGKQFYTFRSSVQNGKTAAFAFIEPDGRSKTEQIAIVDGSSPLKGILGGDFDYVDAILKKSSTRVQPKTERLAGSDCYILQARGPHGSYKLWFDPDRGYNIVKAKVIKTQPDLAWRNQPLTPLQFARQPAAKVYFTFTLENVICKKTDNVWVPVTANYTARIKHVSGRTVTVKSSITRNQIIIDPQFDASDFTPDNIPNGTKVAVIPDKSPYIWMDGKPVRQ